MTVHEVRPDKKLLRRRRRILYRVVAEHLGRMGDDLAGFSLVTWDHRGEPNTGFLAGGPIGRGFIPAFTSDALNRHIAVSLAQESATDRIEDGDDSA